MKDPKRSPRRARHRAQLPPSYANLPHAQTLKTPSNLLKTLFFAGFLITFFSLHCSRRAKTPPRRPKRPPKPPKMRQDGFFEPTWAHVGANMEPCWHQNRISKVSYAKTTWKLKMLLIFPIYVLRFFLNSGVYFWDKIEQKSNGKAHPSSKG